MNRNMPRALVYKLMGLLVLAALVPYCTTPREGDMNGIAQDYVRLVLAVGQHDEGYVDAYYGPASLRTEAALATRPLADIRRDAMQLQERLRGSRADLSDEFASLRHQYLTKQLEAMVAYVDILDGKHLSFDDESRALYDAVAPTRPTSYFADARERLDEMLPGDGPLGDRLEAFYDQFTIPPDRLDAVFTAAIDECRRRTLSRIDLPENESFEVEYVTDKPWSAYNWYKGDAHSLIQVNTELPIRISRAIDLACHEGYPGHHVYNVLLEQQLVRDRGWVEFSIYPLFSPQSLIAEGSANFGIDVAFPGGERVAFEHDVLFPLAGIDPEKASIYYRVEELMNAFSYAGNEAARQYLNGELDRGDTVAWLVEHALSSQARAEQRVRFYDAYRSYVINYNLGQDLVRDYVNRLGGTEDRPERRWEVFMGLLASPRLPSGLR